MKRATRFALFAGVAALLGACQSGSTTPQATVTLSPEKSIENIKTALHKNFPTMEVQSVTAIEGFPGIFEVQTDEDTVYMDPSAKYVLIGQLLDIKSRTNLTEKAQQKQVEQAMKKLPYESAIKEVRGNGKRTLILFSDPDCPFCRKVEQSIQELDNVTVYTFLTPLPELHPDSPRKSRAIWCAEDRLKAWTGYMRQNDPLPTLNPLCKAPEDVWSKLQKKFKVRATPTLLFMNGKIVPGALDKEGIEKIFEELETKTKEKKADAK